MCTCVYVCSGFRLLVNGSEGRGDSLSRVLLFLALRKGQSFHFPCLIKEQSRDVIYVTVKIGGHLVSEVKRALIICQTTVI